MKNQQETKIEIRRKFVSVSAAARAIGVDKQDLFNFLAGRNNHVSKERQRIIRQAFYAHGWLKRKRGPKCICKKCGNVHRMKTIRKAIPNYRHHRGYSLFSPGRTL